MDKPIENAGYSESARGRSAGSSGANWLNPIGIAEGTRGQVVRHSEEQSHPRCVMRDGEKFRSIS